MSEVTLSELEQKMQRAVLQSASQRRQRKAMRAKIAADSQKVSLSQSRDSISFEGVSYSLIFAHGNLQVDKAFKVAIRKNGYTSEERHEIFEQIKKLVADSSLAKSKIYGSPSAGEVSIVKHGKAV